MEPSLFIPSISFATSTQNSILLDPIAQLSDEYDLTEINEVRTRLHLKINGLPNEMHRQIVDNHIRTNARQLLQNLQKLKYFGATADHLRQTGLETLRKLESTSMLMIHDFEYFQLGNLELEHRYSVFDANTAAPATTLNWVPYSNAPVQNPLMRAIGQYMIQPSVQQPSVLDSVVQKVNREMEKTVSNAPARPTYSQAKSAYAAVKKLKQLKEVVGGKLEQNFDSKIFINGCASRISYVLQQAGYKIPIIPGQTVSGKNEEQYIYRLSELEKFIRKIFGPPDCQWRNGSVVGKSNGECSSLDGRKGILIERWAPSPHTTCTGHAKIINGKRLDSFPPVQGVFWELPHDGKELDDDIEMNQEYENPSYRHEEWELY